jgi:hypothetical protein
MNKKPQQQQATQLVAVSLLMHGALGYTGALGYPSIYPSHSSS